MSGEVSIECQSRASQVRSRVDQHLTADAFAVHMIHFIYSTVYFLIQASHFCFVTVNRFFSLTV